jgi:hypothetical protein
MSNLFLKNCENRVQKQISYVKFSKRCHDCPKIIIPNIVHSTNQHWMNQSFSDGYGFIPQEI